MRLNDALITSERYRGEATTDDEGKTQWPVCILWDDELKGFGVRIFPPVRGRPSRKDFIVTWKIGLRTRTMSIGTFGVDCTLRQARKVARDAIDLARRGQDPIEARQRALGIGTAEDLASRFLFEHNAARKKPGIPGDEAATAPGAESDGGSAAVAPPEDSPIDRVGADVADVAGAADAAPDASAALPSEPAEDSVPVAPPERAAEPFEAPVPSDDDADSEPEPAFRPAPAAPPAAPATHRANTPPPGYRRPPHEANLRALAAPSPPVASATPAPAAPPASNAPLVAELARRVAAPPPPVKRGPTKVRLLPVPDALYKVIEHGARESEMTIAAYLNGLVEIVRAAVGEVPVGAQREGADGPAPDETGPSIRELFAQVQEAQAVEVGGPDRGDLDRNPG